MKVVIKLLWTCSTYTYL